MLIDHQGQDKSDMWQVLFMGMRTTLLGCVRSNKGFGL